MVAQKENSSILLEDSYANNYDGFDPKFNGSIYHLFIVSECLHGSKFEFCTLVQKQIKNKVGMLDRGVKQAGFLVLWKTAMPSVLIETGFLRIIKMKSFLLLKAAG